MSATWIVLMFRSLDSLAAPQKSWIERILELGNLPKDIDRQLEDLSIQEGGELVRRFRSTEGALAERERWKAPEKLFADFQPPSDASDDAVGIILTAEPLWSSGNDGIAERVGFLIPAARAARPREELHVLNKILEPMIRELRPDLLVQGIDLGHSPTMAELRRGVPNGGIPRIGYFPEKFVKTKSPAVWEQFRAMINGPDGPSLSDDPDWIPGWTRELDDGSLLYRFDSRETTSRPNVMGFFRNELGLTASADR